MTLSTFRDRLYRLGPGWMRAEVDGIPGTIGRFMYGIGVQFDALIDLTAKGVRARFPSCSPPDGLAAIGRDRKIPRGFSESAQSYAARLAGWIKDRKTKGNPYTLMRQLQGYLTGHSVRLRVVNNAGAWYTLHAGATVEYHRPSGNWNWDGNSAPWSRFWVVIYPPATLWNDEGQWGDGTTLWGDGGTWGTTATSEQVETIQALIAEWKPPHCRCEYIIVAFDPDSFDPQNPVVSDGLWGNWSKEVAGNRTTSRLTTARYWAGEA